MKTIFVLAIFALVCAIKCETYTDRYDTVDLDEVLSNKRLLGAYLKCVLDQGRCTAEGKELKSHITDALESGCSKCTAAQRRGMRQVISHLIHHENDYWQQLVEMYDPDRTYSKKYERELNSV